MMELTLKKTTAKKLFPESPVWFQKVLIETFGENYFKKRDYTDIKTFADACEECGTTEEEFNERFASLGLDADTINYEKAKIVVKAINQGWTPDWSNSNQYKYWPYFNLSSGFGFSDSICYYADTHTTVGSRLCTDTSEKAMYIAEKFQAEYQEYFLYPE